MERARQRWVIGGVGFAAVASLAIGAVLVLRDDGDANEPPGRTTPPAGVTSDTAGGEAGDRSADARPPSGVTVALTRLVPGSPGVNVGHETELVVQASAVAPLDAIELWANGELVAREAGVGGDPTWQGVLPWRPAEPGVTTLVARVVDEDGRSATSNAVRLVAVEPEAPLPLHPHVVAEGETPAAIIERYGLGDAGADLFAGRLLDEPLPAGTELAVPVVAGIGRVPPTPEAGEPDTPSGSAPGPHRVASFADDSPPAMTLDEDGCRATISASGASAGTAVDEYALVELLPDGRWFEQVATSADGVFADVAVAPGAAMFAVESVDGAIRSTSPPVGVTGADDCGGDWTGPLRLVHGVLLGVPDDIDSVYLYVGTAGAWQRVPAQDQATIPRRGGAFGFGAEMVDLSGSEQVEIEGWGWRGGELIGLGRSRFEADPGYDVSAVIGVGGGARLSIVMPSDEPGSLDRLSAEEWIEQPGVQRFRWTSSIAGTTHGIWQVLAFDPQAGASPFVAGVLAEGIVVGSGGDFTIPLGAIPGVQAEAEVPLVSSYADLAGPAAAELVAALPSTPPPPGGVSLAGTLASLSPVEGEGLVIPPVDDLYVRVVPMVGDHWPGKATNDVVVHTGQPEMNLDPGVIDALGELAADPDSLPFELDATLSTPKPPNPAFENCWAFVKWRPDLMDPAKHSADYAFWYAFLADIGAGTPICPGQCYWYSGAGGPMPGWVSFGGASCGSGGGFNPLGDLWEATTSVWDNLVGLFNQLKGVIVEAIVQLSGCEEIGGEIVDDDDADAFCKKVATLAVDVALIYFGIPPNLPESAQLKALAKGELKEVLLEAAKALGIPCDEIAAAAGTADQDDLTCEALADELLAEVEAQLAKIYIQAAAGSGISFPPGAVIEPSPQGQTTPPVVSVTVRPTPGAPIAGGKECSVILSVGAEWWPGLSPVQPAHAAVTAAHGLSGAYLPSYFGVVLHGLAWFAKYTGPVTALAVRELPTEGLVHQPSGPQPSAARTYVLNPLPRDPVFAKSFLFQTNPTGVMVPYHALQLHSGSTVRAEIYSPCTGLYRATTTLGPFVDSVPFTAVGG